MKQPYLMTIVLLSVSFSASAQYRDGQPPVISQPIPVDEENYGAEVVDSFRQRYKSAKLPKIALFWNRELTDNIARQVAQRTTTGATKSESATGGESRSEKLEQTSSTSVVTQESIDDNHRDSIDPRSDALLKSTFISTMRSADAQFIDRALMVRASATQEGPGVDAQSNEMKGLQSKAQFLMQVLLVKDAKAPLGYGFSVSVTNIHSAALIAEFYTPAVPPKRGSNGYVAVNGGQGFVPAPVAPPTIREVGYTLAVEVMGQLTTVMQGV